MPTGRVKWFNHQKGFGFIIPDDGGYVLFVRANTIEGGYLRENEEVKYEVGMEQKGPYAKSVTVIAKQHSRIDTVQNIRIHREFQQTYLNPGNPINS